MKITEENHKIIAKELSRVVGYEELLHALASNNFYDSIRATNKPEIDMAYHLGYKEALQDFTRLLDRQ